MWCYLDKTYKSSEDLGLGWSGLDFGTGVSVIDLGWAAVLGAGVEMTGEAGEPGILWLDLLCLFSPNGRAGFISFAVFCGGGRGSVGNFPEAPSART